MRRLVLAALAALSLVLVPAVASAQEDISPKVTLQAGPACDEVQAALENFAEGEHTVIIFASNAQLGQNFTVPFDKNTGSDVLVDFRPVGAGKVTVEVDGISDSLTLPGCPAALPVRTPPKVHPPASTPSSLPFTGPGHILVLLAVAAGLVCAGTFLMLASRHGRQP